MFINPDSRIEQKKIDQIKKKTKASRGFLKTLFSITSESDEEKVEELISEVDRYGEDLQRNRDFISFEKYKKAVKRLMNRIVEQNRLVKKTTGKNLLGQRKLYIIKNINSELETMTRDIIDNRDVISVVNKIDDVRGMLVDIYSE